MSELRVDFEAWLRTASNYNATAILKNGDGSYEFLATEAAFEGWKAAMAHAVPDGFVVVPKVPNMDRVKAVIRCITDGDDADVERDFHEMCGRVLHIYAELTAPVDAQEAKV